MPKVATKVAMSMPEELYRAVEHIRKKSGRTRSAIMQEALRFWLQQQRYRRFIREYESGYRRKPESRREIEVAEAAAVSLLSSQEW